MKPSASREMASMYIVSSVRSRCLSAARKVRTFRVPVHMLCLITKGETVVLVNGEICRIRPLELYVLGPDMRIETPAQCGPIEYYVVLFKPVTLMKSRGKLSVSNASSLPGGLSYGHIPLRYPQQALKLLIKLAQAYKRGTKESAFALRHQLETLIAELTQPMSETSVHTDSRIVSTITYIENSYEDRLSVEKLAEKVGMTTSAYSKLFRKSTGCLPIEYMNQLRIDKAKPLLRMNDSRVKEVAAAVGFGSEFYFSRIFQRMVGVSPTIYMKRDKLRVAVASSLDFHNYLPSLGIEPVYIADLYAYPGMSNQEYTELLEQSLDNMKEARPDLILCDHYHMELRERFKVFASHIFIDFHGWAWRTNFMKIAELLDRKHEAEQTLARLELRIADVRQELKGRFKNKRVTVMQVNHKGIGVQGKGNHPLNELLYADLAVAPGLQTPSDTWRWEFQPEALPCLETDYLFIHMHHLRAGSEAVFNRMLQTASWSEMSAVREHKVLMIPNWFVMSWTPIGRNQIIDLLLTLE